MSITLFTKNCINLVIASSMLIGVATGSVAVEIDHANAGYLRDSQGSIVRSDYGLCWNAGATSKANIECDPKPAPAPVAVVADPAPKPVAVVAKQPKPVAERVTLDADTLFDFDKSTLRPAGRHALDVFIAGLTDISPEVISAIGHADRFGTDAYNQRLSEQRAVSVKAYLVSKGVDADRVTTEGKGATQPVTKEGDCQGARSTKILACLQADRRVDVEVIGNRINRVTMQ